MHMHRPVGRAAASRKYDLITALGAFALSQDKAVQRRTLRLITLVTARYNWTRDELTVGQREIAALWSVNERTVKREMARLRGLGWLVVKRQGTRGRVTEYRLDIETVLSDTAAHWGCVGPDFKARLEETNAGPAPVPVARGPVVPPPNVEAGTEWALACAAIHNEDEAVYASWVRALERADRSGGRLTLRAPSRFHATYVQTHLEHRLLAACRTVDASVSEIRIQCG